MTLTQSMTHYLKAIYMLQQDNNQGARVSDVARKRGVTKPSVSRAVNNLESAGYVYRENQLVCLTATGLTTASSILENFNAIQDYLINSVGLDSNTSTKVACALEHVLDSEKVKVIASG